MKKKSIISMIRRNNNALYDDHLCLFRCICYHLYGNKFERKTIELAESYCHRFQLSMHAFKGISLEAIPIVEDFCQVNIVVYSLIEERCCGGEVVAKKVRESRRAYDTTVNVNLYKNHFSYIKCIVNRSVCATARLGRSLI